MSLNRSMHAVNIYEQSELCWSYEKNWKNEM